MNKHKFIFNTFSLIITSLRFKGFFQKIVLSPPYRLNCRMKYIIILILFSIKNMYAQGTIYVAYKEKCPLVFSANSYEFDLEIKNNKRIRLDITSMKNYIFDKPGFSTIYPIIIHKHSENHNCTNIHLPEKLVFFTEKFNMKFIDSTFRLNSPIIKNQSTEGNFVEIQVFVECFNNSKIELQNFKLETAGIGTQISGILDSKYIKLKKGINTLKYNLKGICSLNSYIQFDFFDNANNPHSISLPSPIQNN